MSVNNIQANVQSAEQYKIRKQTEIKQAEELQQQVQQAEQAVQQVQQQVDEYDKANPVGEQVEGIYSVSHDEAGNLKIDYKQPASKTEESSEKSNTMTVKANEKSGEARGGAAPAATSSTEESDSDSDDDDDAELEKLKQQRDSIKQQLNREADEEVKTALRAQLQAIEVQIALKSSGTD